MRIIASLFIIHVLVPPFGMVIVKLVTLCLLYLCQRNKNVSTNFVWPIIKSKFYVRNAVKIYFCTIIKGVSHHYKYVSSFINLLCASRGQLFIFQKVSIPTKKKPSFNFSIRLVKIFSTPIIKLANAIAGFGCLKQNHSNALLFMTFVQFVFFIDQTNATLY